MTTDTDQTKTTESDIEREKRHRHFAKEIVDCFYAVAEDYEQLRAERDIAWITEALWKELIPDDQRFLTEGLFKDAVPRILTGLDQLFARGGLQTAPERLSALFTGMLGQHSHDPSLAMGFMAGFRSEIAALTQRPPRIHTAPNMIRAALAAAKAEAPDQAPAIQCCVVLHGMPSAVEGSLSETPEGGLRMLSPTGRRSPGVIPMIEQFFDYQDVIMFATRVDVRLDQPKIHTT